MIDVSYEGAMQFKLEPDQISIYWNYIKLAIEETSPNVTPQGTNVILENLLAGAMQCWFVIQNEDDDFKLRAVIITAFFRDNFFRRNTLRICCVYGFVKLIDAEWQEAIEIFMRFAKENNCAYIEAFTEHKNLALRALQQTKGRMDYHILMEV